MLAGEYAVLDGAPALVMAVNRRAWARRVAAGSAGHPAAVSPLAAAVAATVGADASALELDSVAFQAAAPDGTATKLGLGSSAALAAALCRLLMPAGSDAATVCAAAMTAHRRFQGGAGSGADVAASVFGGLLSYRMGEPDIRPLSWLPGLRFSAWWSGVPASTTAKLARLAASGGSAARDALGAAAGGVAAAWREGAVDPLLAALAAYVQDLAAFDTAHELGIFGGGHDRLARAAADCGVVYKPCGAGGGDVGIALATDTAALAHFGHIATGNGFVRLDLDLEPRGALCEEPAS